MNGANNREPATTTSIHPKAVLFDVDGVITDTSEAHATAWKRLFDEFLVARAERNGEEFRAFDADREYREFVDGKPRLEGIRSFLRSRGVELPEGSQSDSASDETIIGLGNAKQGYFRSWLEENQVHTYPGTLRFMRGLDRAGVRTGAFSASRNAADVLRNAGVLDKFDAKVDGKDQAHLDLPGKPDPASLLEAASQLGVEPGRTAIVEDAISGVEAGTRGGFGIVIGVDRGAYGEALKQAGAHIVVRDLSELHVGEDGRITTKTTDSVPHLWDCEQEVQARLSGRALAVFLDYDGTLTPIVEDHTRAFLGDDVRAAVAELANACTVAIITGRDLEQIQELVKVDSVFFAGSHGFEIAGPDGSNERLERGVESLPAIDEAEGRLREGLSEIAGHSVERKRFSIAVHYRQAAEEDVPRIEAVVDDVLSHCDGLRKGRGKKVLRIQPRIDWHKGRAVRWLLDRFERDKPGSLPIYVGDDTTDEDAFHTLAGSGLTVVVRDDEPRQTAADYSVANTNEVLRLIEWITATNADKRKSDGGGQ